MRGVALALRKRYRTDVYTESRVPRTVYGVRSAVTTVSVPNLLVVRVTSMTRRPTGSHGCYSRVRTSLNAHREAARFSARAADTAYPLSLHPARRGGRRQRR